MNSFTATDGNRTDFYYLEDFSFNMNAIFSRFNHKKTKQNLYFCLNYFQNENKSATN